MVKIIGPYDEFDQCGLSFDGVVSMTQQHFKQECDINFILKRFSETGFLVDPSVSRCSPRSPIFGDFSDVDYRRSCDLVMDIEDEFSRLPSALRDRFDNDPGLLLEFLSDPKNHDEAVRLGLKVDSPVRDEPVDSAGKSSEVVSEEKV